jgi:hypothetical protein
LETVVKENVEAHLAAIDALPATQHGFRRGRSCTTALAASHAEWVEAARHNIVGILSFDLSAAFDTLDPAVLLPKLSALGILGRSNRWFASYLSGGLQVVDWNGTRSLPVAVKYGVRQGSILGPLLYLVHVADMPDTVSVAVEDDNLNGTYADDSQVAAVGKTTESVLGDLSKKAELFTKWAKGNGLAINGGKTQLLLSSGARYNADTAITVDDKTVKPRDELELLGVTLNRRLEFNPHNKQVVANARARASMIARLSHHLPRGEFLRQLALGLAVGKVAHALPAVYYPRLLDSDRHSGHAKDTQIAMNNIARSVSGLKKTEHIRVCDLLDAARIPSINRLAVAATALEAWKAHKSTDGDNGDRNPAGTIMFGNRPSGGGGRNVIEHGARVLRGAAAGEVAVPLRGSTSFVTNATRIWNACPTLRVANTLAEAKMAAKSLADTAPI